MAQAWPGAAGGSGPAPAHGPIPPPAGDGGAGHRGPAPDDCLRLRLWRRTRRHCTARHAAPAAAPASGAAVAGRNCGAPTRALPLGNCTVGTPPAYPGAWASRSRSRPARRLIPSHRRRPGLPGRVLRRLPIRAPGPRDPGRSQPIASFRHAAGARPPPRGAERVLVRSRPTSAPAGARAGAHALPCLRQRGQPQRFPALAGGRCTVARSAHPLRSLLRDLARAPACNASAPGRASRAARRLPRHRLRRGRPLTRPGSRGGPILGCTRSSARQVVAARSSAGQLAAARC